MKKVVAYIILTAVLFSTMEIALKIGGTQLDSLQMTNLRFLIGGLILSPFGIHESRTRNTSLQIKDLGWLLLVGIMGIPVSMLSFQLGVERCNAATAASLICLNPLFTMVIAHIFTSEKMNSSKWLAFAIGCIAAFFLIRPWDIQPGNTPLGMALLLFASITFAAYTVMGKQSIDNIGTFTQTSLSFIFGSLVLFNVMLIMDRPVIDGVAENLPVILYSGFFVTGLGYLFYFLAIKNSDASTGSLAFFVKPAIAPILAMIFLHESIYWNTVVGVTLLISASVIKLRDASVSKNIAHEDDELDVLVDEFEERLEETRVAR